MNNQTQGQQAPAKKTPLRKCMGCNEMKPKRDLIRVVRSPEGVIALDKTGKSNGRGAYICPDPACFKTLKKRRGLERSFKCPVDGSVYEALEAALEAIAVKNADASHDTAQEDTQP